MTNITQLPLPGIPGAPQRKPLSGLQKARGAKIYAAISNGTATSYNDIAKASGLSWHDVMNTLHLIRTRPSDFGFEIAYAAHGPNLNDEKRYYARRLDGVRRPFKKDELAQYMKGEAAKLRLMQTYATNMSRMMKEFAQDMPGLEGQIRQIMANQISGFQQTLGVLITMGKRSA